MTKKIKNIVIWMLLKISLYSKIIQLIRKQPPNSMRSYYNVIHSKFILAFIKSPKNFHKSKLILNSSQLESCVQDDLPEINEYKDVWFIPDLRAVYKNNGEIISSSIFKRETVLFNTQPSIIDIEQLKNTKQINKALYGGLILGNHYGHFLIETLSRLWPLAILDMASYLLDSKILYWSQEKKMGAIEKPCIKPAQMILESLKIKSNIRIVRQPVHIKKLIIPGQATILDNKFHSIFGDLLRLAGMGIMSEYKPLLKNRDYPARIYLSRTKLDYYRRNCGNEKLLEKILKRHAFEIIHPQELSLPDQICMFSKARVIVGSYGSAFHTMLLAKISDQKILCLTENAPDLTSTGIDQICNSNTKYIRCMYPHPLCVKKSGGGTTMDRIIDVKRALDGILPYI